MPGPQSDDEEETVGIAKIWEEIIDRVANCLEAVRPVLAMVCFVWAVEYWWHSAYDITSIESFIVDMVASIACMVIAVVPFIKKLIAILRTGDNGDSENEDTVDQVIETSSDSASVGSGSDGEVVIVQPTILTPPAVVTTIPSSSSSRSGGGGGVSAGSGVVTAADVELGAASHHRRGERERSHVDISGEAVKYGKRKNA